MSYQAFFKRYEIKYLMSAEQHQMLLEVLRPYMALDCYGRTTIRNIYFDTDSYQLIRHSMERPVYKEKLRIRSYGRAQEDSPVFVELKKKYDSVVYKRRVAMTEKQAIDWLCREDYRPESTQIVREIDYFRRFYNSLHPAMFLCYERDAYYSKDGDSFRLTFDTNITCRESDLSLGADAWGERLLAQDQVLMEIKTVGSIPLWLTNWLTRNRLYRTPYSKYGAAYSHDILTGRTGGWQYA